MNDMKWAWVLFGLATLVVLVRLFMSSPLVRHSAQVADAAEVTSVPVPEAEVVESSASVPAEPAWPDEAVEPEDLPLPAPAPAPPMLEVAAPPAPTPEEFHFRQTRWGMPIEEVRASESGEPLRENERGLLYATTTLELPCLLTYSFAQGRLVRARLAFSDPTGKDIPPLTLAQAQRRFLYLREQLRARYGEPLQKTVHMPRDVSNLQRAVLKQGELAQQYDTEIAEAEQRLQQQRGVLERRFAQWPNRNEMIARDLAPYERDLRELRVWKQEAMDRAAQSRHNIQQSQSADASNPLIATLSARWPFARELHDIELRLDGRFAVPRLDIRYEANQSLPGIWQIHEL